ncbi:hypothetical protein [Rummeliibacillus sp. G93]|nr:hypothetical protein [Rummeliibacillus sp. G93]
MTNLLALQKMEEKKTFGNDAGVTPYGSCVAGSCIGPSTGQN